ncbi:MAG TPA: secretin N-terminal domain-containing protein [Humisphaera sp.]|jgi:type II secretory pathway component GspD/PulD (secretin)|nr:secretin N-terminal domain-containing protein [Humisphaera sp.]
MSVNASGQVAASQPATQPSKAAVSAGREPEIRLFRLERLDATEFASLVTAIFKSEAARGPADATWGVGDLHSVHVETQTNTLVAVGDVQAVSVIEGLVQKLDLPETKSQQELRHFQLRSASATDATKILDGLFRSEPQAALPSTRPANVALRFPVRVVPDAKANTLFVLADAESMRLVEEVLNKLEVNDGPTEPPDLCVFHLEHAKAGPAATMLMALFKFEGFPPVQDAEAVQDPWYFNAVAYEPTNSVMMAGSRAAIHKATEILEEVERSSTPTTNPTTQKAEQPTTFKFDLRRADE